MEITNPKTISKEHLDMIKEHLRVVCDVATAVPSGQDVVGTQTNPNWINTQTVTGQTLFC